MKKNSFLKIYKNKKVLVTGSTGFKGSWLTFWLHKLGAKVVGVGLKPEKDFKLYDELKLKNKIKQYILNIENYEKLNAVIKKEKPDIIFHLAAQSIVSSSFKFPLKTIFTNVLGSSNVLEAVRNNQVKALVFITSDKCYLNNEKKKNYKENDRLGGFDNYSASKASAEILFHSYFQSFFKNSKKIYVGSARAGNVIGGGDFKKNRIIPDFFKAVTKNKALTLRNPKSTRPWQHVLEPLSGYLKLGDLLLRKKINKKKYPSWNFGPNPINCKQVIKIISMFYDSMLLKPKIKIIKSKTLKESGLLSLNISKAKKELHWEPRLTLQESIDFTADWYQKFYLSENVEDFTTKQIKLYLKN